MNDSATTISRLQDAEFSLYNNVIGTRHQMQDRTKCHPVHVQTFDVYFIRIIV